MEKTMLKTIRSATKKTKIIAFIIIIPYSFYMCWKMIGKPCSCSVCHEA